MCFRIGIRSSGRKLRDPRVAAALVGIQAGDVWAFEPVTVRASEGEIAFDRLATMLFGDNVIDLERQRQRKLWDPAVLAAIGGALADETRQFLIHCFWRSSPFRACRARDCTTARSLPICR
jgi:hypothetical protein